MAAQRLGKRVLSKLQSPSRARGPGGSPGGLQKRHARVTVKYDRRELQRRLDVEKWIDGRLEELYRGRVRLGAVRGQRRVWGSRSDTPLFRTPYALGVSGCLCWPLSHKGMRAQGLIGPCCVPSLGLCLWTQTPA